MEIKNLKQGKILKRYKRFFVDVELDSGEVVTSHCANTGPMTSALESGWKCLVSYNPDPKRKLQYSLQFTNNGKHWIGVNTHLTNTLVKEALQQKLIPELAAYNKIIPEVTFEESRLDFLLEDHLGKKCYVEVKNVSTLISENFGVFPDTVSDRASKHLDTLSKIRKLGFRTVVLFIAQREDILDFSPNFKKDIIFSESLIARIAEGVEVLVYGCKLDLPQIQIAKKLNFKPTRIF